MKKRWISGALACVLLVACATSPTGRRQLILFSDGEVAQLGLTSFEQLKKEEKISTDKKKTRFVRCVADAIVHQIPASYNYSTQDWQVELFDSPDVNAFALPGGRIGVYTGLFKAVNNQDQLAAVLGHEVAHVLARHSNERLSQSQLAGVGMVAADAALGDASYREPAMAALGIGAQVGVLLPYGRIQETEADVLGLQLMAMAGFKPEQAISLWQNMAQISGGKKPPEFLSTHPSDQHRIDELSRQLDAVTPLYTKARELGRKPQCQF
ncbi:M48 family metallopeptidase [Pseudaeromonas sharmana]|uniref:M48 family metallopeptidase n=1 Tax=Pseudaeromonas sharmana TaxID=328412 RepID=A0ABV8CJW5_9GAMM